MYGCHKSDCLSACCVEFRSKIEKLEKFHSEWKGMPRYDLKECIDLVNEHNEKIKELEKRINEVLKISVKDYCVLENDIIKLQLGNNKKPHKCPVCGGSGALELESIEECNKYKNKFNTYDNGKPFIWCKSCEGKGILWG